VSSIDLLPTILELLDIDVSADLSRQLRGTSLVELMNGQRVVARDVFSETDYRAYTFKRSIIAPDGWKLIYTLESQTRELYDLTNDPTETRDLASARSDHADELQRRLFAHFRSIGHDLRQQEWRVGLNPVYASQAQDDSPPAKPESRSPGSADDGERN
jgi:arylsulfatase A-like enzyme